MTPATRRPFNYRALWSLLLAASLPGLPWSGIALHSAGHGGWTTSTHAWMGIHWVFALVFTAGAVGHLVLNGRALLRYMRSPSARTLILSREALVALVVSAGLMLLALGHARADHLQNTPGLEDGSVAGGHQLPERED